MLKVYELTICEIKMGASKKLFFWTFVIKNIKNMAIYDIFPQFFTKIIFKTL